MTSIVSKPKFSIAMVNYKTLELTKIALELLKIDGPDSNKAAAKLFQWSITYLSVFSLLLVIAALVVNP